MFLTILMGNKMSPQYLSISSNYSSSTCAQNNQRQSRTTSCEVLCNTPPAGHLYSCSSYPQNTCCLCVFSHEKLSNGECKCQSLKCGFLHPPLRAPLLLLLSLTPLPLPVLPVPHLPRAHLRSSQTMTPSLRQAAQQHSTQRCSLSSTRA